MEPSLYSLYRRSRYSPRHEDSPESREEWERRELFAVSAVAFALKHCKAFRNHFLGTICGWTEPKCAEPQIELEPCKHADLELRDEAHSRLCIVEFKLGAKLQPHQNPSNEAFFQPDGYGTLILNGRDYSGFARKTYVVLDELERFSEGKQGQLTWRARAWSAVAPHGPGSLSPLWEDLLDVLGDLGVDAFHMEKYRNLNLSPYTKQTAAMYELLKEAGKVLLGLGGRDVLSFDNWFDKDHSYSCYGLNIPVKKSSLREIETRANPPGNHLGWFGYEQPKNEHWLGVYFYCGSKNDAQNVLDFVQAKLYSANEANSESPKVFKDGVTCQFAEDDDTAVRIRGLPSAVSDDISWFEAVFKALRD